MATVHELGHQHQMEEEHACLFDDVRRTNGRPVMTVFGAGRTRVKRNPYMVGLLLAAVLSGCGGGATVEPQGSTPSPAPSTPPSPATGGTATPLPNTTEPVGLEPGMYRISESVWSVADFSVTFPEGWAVQYGHTYLKHADTSNELGFYPVVINAIYSDSCQGSNGELMKVGPSVDDLAAALLQQTGPTASGPVETTLGGHPATRIDLTVPEGFDLEPCNVAGIGLQVWYSPQADKHFVLLSDGIASVYILDVNGQRQVFLTQHSRATSAEDLLELQAVLDSIHIET